MGQSSYFSHDSNALSDIKISAMRCDYGLEGYGLFWAIIEMLRKEDTYKLPLSKNMYRKIKIDTGTTIDVEKFINDCINEYKEFEDGNGLFNTDGKYFWSESLLKRMTKMEEISIKRKQAGQKGAAGRWKKSGEENNEKTSKNGKRIANAITYHGKCYKNYGKPMASYSKGIAKNSKIKSKSKYKYKDIDKILSIYPNPSFQKSKIENDEMDKIDETEFQKIIINSQVNLYETGLSNEIIEIIRELYKDDKYKNKIRNIKLQHIDLAIRNFKDANAKTHIQMPKNYFKKCLMSALDELQLTQLDFDGGG